jgi:hypothetical protein
MPFSGETVVYQEQMIRNASTGGDVIGVKDLYAARE